MANKLQPTFLLKLFLGLVFISAGIYRIFNWSEALTEISSLGIGFTAVTSTLVVGLEIIGGILLIFNIQTKKVLTVFATFLILAILTALALSWSEIINTLAPLFTFKATSTDVFLHFTYLIILIYLILNAKEKN